MFSSLIHYFNAGGIVMYPLIILLVIVGMIGFERASFYKAFRKDAIRFHKTAMSAESMDTWEEMVELFNCEPSPMMSSVYIITKKVKRRENLESRYDDLVELTAIELKKGLDWLSIIVTAAPLLGLLGTVVGMIRSFQIIGNGAQTPMVITGGVGEALIATATGLVVALIALGVYSFCRHMTNNFIAFLEFNLGRMLDLYDGSHE